jgi:hypothetical protein
MELIYDDNNGSVRDYRYGLAKLETKKDLKNVAKHSIVNTGFSDVEEIPIVSFGFYGCNALVLFSKEKNHPKAALAHISTLCYPPIHIKWMLKRIDAEARSLEAIIVTGVYDMNLEEHCKEYGISVKEKIQDASFGRDVMVIPSLKEIRIYTDNGKIVRQY